MKDDIKIDNYIISDPNICSGKPCIKKTRIPVHMIVDLMAVGETVDNIKVAYPNLSKKQIYACLKYAALLVDEEAGVIA